jgi:hypothetical protein
VAALGGAERAQAVEVRARQRGRAAPGRGVVVARDLDEGPAGCVAVAREVAGHREGDPQAVTSLSS